MQHNLLINGKLVAGEGEKVPVYNPATGEVILEIAEATAAQVDAAVEAADRAFDAWSQTTPKTRAECLLKLADAISAQAETLAQLESLNCGKPLHCVINDEMPAIADVFRFFAGAARCLPGMAAGEYLEGHTSMIRRDPVGVVASIAPWNYPLMMAAWKLAPALAAGNAMIFKPSEVTPLTALKLAEIYTEAGLPDGVFNVLPGVGAETGQYLTEHPGIAKVSFTGGVASGKKVMANSAASSLKEVTMELGGKSPLIIFDDADLDLAADIAMMANFFSSGQVCTNGTRVFVPAKFKAAYEQKITERVGRIRAGDLFDEATNFGPMVSFPHRDSVMRYIAKGKEEGARVLCGGDVLKGEGFDNGAWVAPTVFTDCTDEMTIVREEIFGPVMSILSYADEAEVIRRANATEYGLAAGVVTPNLNRAHRIIHQLEAGICWINSWGESPAEMPVGGYKHSGIGRENGVMTLQSYTQVKSIQVEMGKFQSIF